MTGRYPPFAAPARLLGAGRRGEPVPRLSRPGASCAVGGPPPSAPAAPRPAAPFGHMFQHAARRIRARRGGAPPCPLRRRARSLHSALRYATPWAGPALPPPKPPYPGRNLNGFWDYTVQHTRRHAEIRTTVRRSVKQAKIMLDGEVQGVGLRESVKTQADRLGLVGQVMNLKDGRVGVVCEGRQDSIEELVGKLRGSPGLATVDNASVSYSESEGEYDSFIVVRGDSDTEMIKIASAGVEQLKIMNGIMNGKLGNIEEGVNDIKEGVNDIKEASTTSGIGAKRGSATSCPRQAGHERDQQEGVPAYPRGDPGRQRQAGCHEQDHPRGVPAGPRVIVRNLA